MTLREAVAAPRAVPERRASQFVVWPHHPDALRLGSAEKPSATQAITWNVFRTLELMPPAFWLRRLQASLGMPPPRPTPITARVRLWPRLAAAPTTTAGARGHVDADVVIETEFGLWALLACDAGDLVPRIAGTSADALAALADAASWRAGRRACWLGVIVANVEDARVASALVRRYGASPDALRLRAPSRAADLGNVEGIGLTTWAQLLTIVRDAAAADTVDEAERAIARRALDWCDRTVVEGR